MDIGCPDLSKKIFPYDLEIISVLKPYNGTHIKVFLTTSR